MELELWIEYCDDPHRAQEFYQDGVREVFEIHRHRPIVDEATKTLEKAAEKFLTGDKRRDAPIYIKDAVKALGPERERYRKQNSDLLSKLVHPTAFSLMALSDPSSDSPIRGQLIPFAKAAVADARKGLREGYLGKVYDKFGPLLIAARQARVGT